LRAPIRLPQQSRSYVNEVADSGSESNDLSYEDEIHRVRLANKLFTEKVLTKQLVAEISPVRQYGDPVPHDFEIILETEYGKKVPVLYAEDEQGKKVQAWTLNNSSQEQLARKILTAKKKFLDRADLISKIRIMQEWWPKFFNTQMAEAKKVHPYVTPNELAALVSKDLRKRGYSIPSATVLRSDTSGQTPQMEAQVLQMIEAAREKRKARTHPATSDEGFDLMLHTIKERMNIVTEDQARIHLKFNTGEEPAKAITGQTINTVRLEMKETYNEMRQVRAALEAENKEDDFEEEGMWGWAKDFYDLQATNRRRARGKAFLAKTNEKRKESNHKLKQEERER